MLRYYRESTEACCMGPLWLSQRHGPDKIDKDCTTLVLPTHTPPPEQGHCCAQQVHAYTLTTQRCVSRQAPFPPTEERAGLTLTITHWAFFCHLNYSLKVTETETAVYKSED